MSFKKVLLICIIVPLFLFCGIFILIRWYGDLRRSQVEYEKMLVQNVSLQRSKLEGYFDNTEEMCINSTSILGRNMSQKDLEHFTDEDFAEYLRALVVRRPEVTAVALALLPKWKPEKPHPIFYYVQKQGSDPALQTISVREYHNDNFQAEAWFAGPAKTNTAIWEEPFDSPRAKEWVLAYSFPIMSDGEFFGVLRIDTSVASYSQSLSRSAAELGPGVYCAVIDREGEYLLHPDLGKVVDKKNLFRNDLVADAGGELAAAERLHRDRKMGIVQVQTRDGKTDGKYYMVLAPINVGKDLAMAVFMPEDNFLSPLRRQLLHGIILLLAGAVFAGGMAAFLTHLILSPFHNVVAAAERIAEGDLEQVDIPTRFKEFSILGDAFNRMISAVKARTGELERSVASRDRILRQVAVSARELTQVAAHVSDQSLDLSSGAAQQESVFDRISGAVARLKDHADSNSRMAGETNAIIGEVECLATAGNFEMRRLFDTMTAISESSKSINNALRIIDGIAFQTNILAINAAVEAARAGRNGKGFSVVASEVRLLANRSAQSVVSTSKTLKDSDTNVAFGVEMGEKTAASLGEIEKSATSAAKLMKTVTDQATDQSHIIGEVLSSLGEVAEIAKRNASNAAANAAVSEELLTLATNLSNMLEERKGAKLRADAAPPKVRTPARPPLRRLPVPESRTGVEPEV